MDSLEVVVDKLVGKVLRRARSKVRTVGNRNLGVVSEVMHG